MLPKKITKKRLLQFSFTKSMSETEIIEEIKLRCEQIFTENFEISIGDDCAVRKQIASGNLLLSADISIEDVHFSRQYMSLYEIGYKSAITNISDIAAMGGNPDFLLVSLALPKLVSKEEILMLYDGIIAAGKEYAVPIVGGDLSESEKIVVSISIGGISSKRILKRSGAKVGDNIWVSGFPGMSGRGLCLLQKHGRKIAQDLDAKAVTAHISPKAQVRLGKYLANNNLVNSCIDVSDGVAKEIRSICAESKKGALLLVPVESLGGGEDYELLFTADKSFLPDFENMNFSKIGEIIQEEEIFLLENGQKKAFKFQGFEHFLST
jgi:thiamine-monophosphate kinase